MTSSPDRYASLSSDEFDRRVRAMVARLGATWLLALPGVYEIAIEELNNAVLEEWEQANPPRTRATVEDEIKAVYVTLADDRRHLRDSSANYRTLAKLKAELDTFPIED